MSTTFAVDDVGESSYKPETELVEMQKIYKGLGKFEAFGGPEKILRRMGPQHGLYHAVSTAYNAHRRLVLSPDHVWLAIARVYAEHITSHAEELRKYFVEHEGQKLIEIRRDDFRKGSSENPWPEAFDEFGARVDLDVKPGVANTFICDFTTTGPIERAVSQVTLMDAMSRYFKYGMVTMCGIPEITLLGEPADWSKLGEKVIDLQPIEGLRTWGAELFEFVRKFHEASQGDVDTEWWKSFYRQGGGSGGEHFDGHVAALFPREDWKTKILRTPSTVYETGISHQFSRVPFLWKYYTQEFRMRFVAGVPFATILEDGAITPASAWAIEEMP